MESDSKKASRRGEERPPKAESAVDAPPPFRRRETAFIVALAIGWLVYVLWNALGQRRPVEPMGAASPATATTATAVPSAAPSSPGPEVDADLFAHDVVAGLIIIQREGPADLRATSEQRDQFDLVWPDVRKNLQNNSTHPSAADQKMRAILTPAQKEAIRKLAAGGQLVLPAHLKVYVPQFEQLLRGVPITAASAEPSIVPTPVPGASGAPATPASGAPAIAASGAPIGNPGAVVDPYLDLFLHDIVGGVIALQDDGPEALRLTPAQREALTALLAKIRKRLQANDPKPTALDDQVRAILTSEQKAAIRTLASSGKVRLPPSLADYTKPFELLLAGKYTKGAMPSPVAAGPGTPSGAPSAVPGKPTGVPAGDQSSPGAKQPAEEPFDDIFLHDAVAGLIAIERDGPASLRLSTAQRKQIEELWPDIRRRLEANDWKPAAIDGKVVGDLTPQQRTAIRTLRASGKLPPPPKLNTYIAPFEAMLKKP